MNGNIRLLSPEEFRNCGGIWDMEKHSDLAARFYSELVAGERITYVYERDGAFLGEISLKPETDEADCTIPGRRIYVSRLIVKPEERRKGIGKALVEHVIRQAIGMGFSELSIGVDIDNYPALRLYADAGFREILFVGEDEQGRYMNLLKRI